MFKKIEGLKIKAYINNEPFSSKDSCDFYSSILKQKLERTVNSGMNASTASEIAEAICSLQCISNVVVQSGSIGSQQKKSFSTPFGTLDEENCFL